MSKAPKPTIKNTKSEILTAYDELLKQVEKNKSLRAQEQKVQMKSDIVQRASSEGAKDIIHKVTELKIQINETLENLGKNLLNERAKLSDLQEAIAIEQARIKDTHEIMINANSLEALLLAQKKKKEEFEQWIEAEKEKFRSEMAEKKTFWAKEKQEYEQAQKDKVELQKKEWKRQEEEYEYQRKILEQKDNDEYQLKKQLLERELEDRRKKLEEEFALRESAISAQEQELGSLRKLKDESEKTLKEHVESARKQLTLELEQKYKFTSELKQKETDAENGLLKQNIKFLEEKLQEKNKTLDILNHQLVSSQAQSQELAKKVIEANSRIREINDNLKERQNLQETDNKSK